MYRNTVGTWDQDIWMNSRTYCDNKIQSLATQQNFDFVPINQLNSLKSNSQVIVSARIFDLIPNKDWFDKVDLQLDHSGQKLVVFTDNIVGDSYNFNNIKIFSIPVILGITATYQDIDVSKSTGQKLFNCFIQRTDSVRQSWFYFLHQKNLLNKGYVSYLLSQLKDYSELEGKDLFSWIHNNFELYNLPHFQQAYINLVDQVPYRNFLEKENLIPLILDSKYTLNLETFANIDRDCWCFTEKSLRSLQMPTVDLMFLQTNGFKVLKDLGFELLDHSKFDSLSWQERQQKLLEILVTDSVTYNKTNLIDKAKHNQDLLLQWKKQIYSDNFFENYFEQIYV